MSCQALLLASLPHFQRMCDDRLGRRHPPNTERQGGCAEAAEKEQMPLLHLLSNPHPTGGASERPPKIPWGREQAASHFSGPAGSVTGEVLAHFWRGASVRRRRETPGENRKAALDIMVANPRTDLSVQLRLPAYRAIIADVRRTHAQVNRRTEQVRQMIMRHERERQRIEKAERIAAPKQSPTLSERPHLDFTPVQSQRTGIGI